MVVPIFKPTLIYSTKDKIDYSSYTKNFSVFVSNLLFQVVKMEEHSVV